MPSVGNAAAESLLRAAESEGSGGSGIAVSAAARGSVMVGTQVVKRPCEALRICSGPHASLRLLLPGRNRPVSHQRSGHSAFTIQMRRSP